MLINESGLVRCIKRAYKSAGYAVATEGDCMTIYTEQWYIQCKRAAIPRKVLATIVEHMGMIPDTEPVSIVKDGEPQLIMPDVAADEIAHWRTGERTDAVTMATVIMQGYQIFQPDGGAWSRCCDRRGPPAVARGHRGGGHERSKKGPVKLGQGMGAGRVERPGGRGSAQRGGMTMGKTNFDRITASPEALAAFLASLPCLDAPWDDAFHRHFCDNCPMEDCPKVCPNEEKRNSPAWWLGLEVSE